MITDLETSSKEVRAYNGTLYLPGVVGLNNIKANDYCNVVLQALSHVTPIRNYFLDANSYAKIKRRPGDQNAHELLVVSYGCNQFVIRVAEIQNTRLLSWGEGHRISRENVSMLL